MGKIVFALIICIWSTAAVAQATPCVPMDAFLKIIEDSGHQMVASAKTAKAGVPHDIVLFAAKGGAALIVSVAPDGEVCIVAQAIGLDFNVKFFEELLSVRRS